MIKKIPIKGISRDPSGQVSADGMCAESLNVQLDMGEVAPMMAPKPVTEYGDDLSVEGDILYIHKGIGYENLIYTGSFPIPGPHGTTTQIDAVMSTSAAYGVQLVFSREDYPGEIKDVTHVGNTLIFSVGDQMVYVLWKSGGYKPLGTKIPIPAIWVGARHTEGLRTDATTVYPAQHEYPSSGAGGASNTVIRWDKDFEQEEVKYTPGALDVDDWNRKTNYYIPDNDVALEIIDKMWGVIDDKIKEARVYATSLFPRFVRYGVRLYDGTVYGCSVPLLVGGDIQKLIDVKLASERTTEQYPEEEESSSHHGNYYWHVYGKVGIPKPYAVALDFTDSSLSSAFSGWEDIVKGIDIFFSDEMYPAKRRNSLMLDNWQLVRDDTYDGEGDLVSGRIVNVDGYIDPTYTEKDNLLDHQETYLVKSIKLDEFSEHTGYEILDDINVDTDWVLNQEPLGESYLSHHQWVSDNLSSYNNSLLLAGAKLHLGHGHPYHVSTKWQESSGKDYIYVYHLRIDGETCYVYSRGPSGTDILIEGKESDDSVYPYDPSQYDHRTYYEVPVAWIAYPDSRCFKVDILKYNSQDQLVKVGSLSMEPLETQDVAYAFVGFGNVIVSEPTYLPRYTTQEKAETNQPNVLIQTKGSNPFVTTPDGVVYMSGNIINIGTVTTPLSEGQFGQFPLYVFTTEGVFVLSMDSNGIFMTNHTVTRELLLDKNSLIAIEQGIFFASARGLMLLQGSTVTKVSELMDGKPDRLSNELAQSIASRFFSGIHIEETAPFYQFLNGCKMAYDYANSRIIIYREGQSDMYVYKFNTQSWHRMAWNPLRTPVRTLNSYPEAFIVESDGLGHQVPMNYSTLTEDPEGLPLPGLVYTRELSLDEIDIYKTINRLRVRGRYTDGHVKWALQGSNDGINYRTLHSLRGPSWKWYRIAVVTLLDAQERISYIELDYTPKFTNKIR